MNSRKLFLASALLYLIGLVSLWSKWNGNAGINAGYPITAWSVTFNGSVHGWAALIGVVALLVAIVTSVVALVRLLMD